MIVDIDYSSPYLLPSFFVLISTFSTFVVLCISFLFFFFFLGQGRVDGEGGQEIVASYKSLSNCF